VVEATPVNVEESVLAALQAADEDGLECPLPFWRPDGMLGLMFKGKEYVTMIAEVTG
jgi:hypothetical protein